MKLQLRSLLCFLIALAAISPIVTAVRAQAADAPSGGPKVTVTRYIPGSHVTQDVYNLTDENGHEVSSAYRTGQEACDALLKEQNAAGLAKTEIPTDLKQVYEDLAKKINGITFVEATGASNEQVSLLEFEQIGEYHVDKSAARSRTAIGWLVPSLFPYNDGLTNEMPWQTEDVFQSDKQQIEAYLPDPASSPIASVLAPEPYDQGINFEFGRLTQFRSGHAKWVYASMGIAALTQVISAGANISKSYVYMHSAHPVNTRGYEIKFKRKPLIKKSLHGVEHALFKVPLIRFLEEFPPSQISTLLGTLKRILPALKEWQIAFIAKEYYDLAEYYGEAGKGTPIRVRTWSKQFKNLGLKVLLDRFGIPGPLQKQVFDLFANQHASAISSDHMSNFAVARDFHVQFELTAGENVLIEVPEQMTPLHLRNPEVMAEFLTQSLLFLLRTPVNRSVVTGDNGQAVMTANMNFMREKDIRVVFSTEDKEITKTLETLGGVTNRSKAATGTATAYTSFTTEQMLRIFTLYLQRRLPPTLPQFGFHGRQLNYQYMERRIAL